MNTPIDTAALAAWVRERFEEASHDPGGIPRQAPEWLISRFAARFLGARGTERVNRCVTRTVFHAPTPEQVARINALWLELRVQRFGEAARHPAPRRRFTLPDAVVEILGRRQ